MLVERARFVAALRHRARDNPRHLPPAILRVTIQVGFVEYDDEKRIVRQLRDVVLEPVIRRRQVVIVTVVLVVRHDQREVRQPAPAQVLRKLRERHQIL
jgi:hypothetical protein